MTRSIDKVAWLLSSLGIALLVCSLVLVPQNLLLADVPLHVCDGNATCDPGPEKCYYHVTHLRCTTNGDWMYVPPYLVLITDQCKTSQANCTDCVCTQHTIAGEPPSYYCSCD